jgi:hypothetical protein
LPRPSFSFKAGEGGDPPTPHPPIQQVSASSFTYGPPPLFLLCIIFLTLINHRITGAGGNQQVKLTNEELDTLRRTLQEQEVLIKGYQAENEGAVRKIKELTEALLRAEAAGADAAVRLLMMLSTPYHQLSDLFPILSYHLVSGEGGATDDACSR